MIDRTQTDLQKLHKKMSREKEKYSILLEKFEKLQSSQSTDKSSQLPLDTTQQKDHDKSEEPQTPTRLLDKDTMTKLTTLQLKMEDVSVSLEKVEVIRKYWMEQVHSCYATRVLVMHMGTRHIHKCLYKRVLYVLHGQTFPSGK